LKTLPRFSLNPFSRFLLGAVLAGLCPSLSAQETPLATPPKVDYPGIIQTFEKLIAVDREKVEKRTRSLAEAGRLFGGANLVSDLDLDPDFLNSIILHSDPGYLRVAATDRCRFYESILTDLLRSADGKIRNVLVTYVEKDVRQAAVVSTQDFLAKVVNQQCPETAKNIAAFQVKTLSQTLAGVDFDIPTGREQCRNVHVAWVNNPQTPFLCQIHEYIEEARAGGGNPKDLANRRAVAKILEDKMTLVQRDYVENLCGNLDDEDAFCEEFLNVSFWTKVAAGYEDKRYVDDVCARAAGTANLSAAEYNQCLARLKKEKDLCLYPAGTNAGLRPQPDCDQLSTALNFSSLKANLKDCPGNSDQLIVTNLGRIVSHFSPGPGPAHQTLCSATSAQLTYAFNKGFDNDENWKLEACYDDRMNEREVCFKTFFGAVPGEPAAYASVVAEILKRTRGADASVTCEMIDAAAYNPLLLNFKTGCYIVFERDQCFVSQCKHKIIYNDRPINEVVKLKGRAALPYFPLSVADERFSQHYLLTRDFKKTGKLLNTLNGLAAFFKKTKGGLVHGVGCAEDLLPSFFKTHALNQCTALPFVLNGMLRDKDKVVFATRTAADALQAPRLLSWSTVFSAVKSYQRGHPLKLWTMYGLE
jgi:hypothetical protein